MEEKLFGIRVYLDGINKIIPLIEERKDKVHIISGNAEVFKYPLSDKETFKKFEDERNIIIPDGVSVYLPIKKRKKQAIERLTGIDLMQELLNHYSSTGENVYFLGAKEDVLLKMISNVKESYPDLGIAGYHHGYIDINNCSDVIDDIKKTSPKAIFVAMGTPVQEEFIFKYIDELPCMLYMGVGGSFDVMSGCISRCPAWISKIGMEWLYRMIKDPSKIKRLWNNLYFTVKGLILG